MKNWQGSCRNSRTKTCINNWKSKKYSFLILKSNKLKRKSKLLMYPNKEHVNLQKNKSEHFNKKLNKHKSKQKC